MKVRITCASNQLRDPVPKVIQMFREVVLLAILLNIVLKSNAECTTTKECGFRRLARSIPLFDKIGNFFKSIKKLFDKKSKEFVHSKKVVENAFTNFFDEVMQKKKISDKLEKDLRLGSDPIPLLGHLPGMPFEEKPHMTTEQLISSHGYYSESHTVLTADGFMLTMHRVIREVDRINDRVVLLHHGLLGSSEDWLLLGTFGALPYMLLENGFDVWLLNARGNRYSRMHTNKSSERIDYWDFSWHEMGVYDLPAEITYITEITNSSDLNFIGHSMGCTALLVLLSTYPQYNTILSSGILIAPLVYMYHVKGPLSMLANFYTENGEHSLTFLGQSEFMKHEVFPQQIIEKYCKGLSMSCYNTLLLLGNGGGGNLWDAKVMKNVLTHVPAGGSVKTVMHYIQLVKSGFFKMFDYGADNNQLKYDNDSPPSYNLSGTPLPMAIFSSPSDWLATRTDIQTLLPHLRDVRIHHVVKTDNFGHFDFMWSPYAKDFIFNFIIPFLDQQLPRRKAAAYDEK